MNSNPDDAFKNRVQPRTQNAPEFSLVVDGNLEVPLHNDYEAPTFSVDVVNGSLVNGSPFNTIGILFGPLEPLDEAKGKELEDHFRSNQVEPGVLLEGPVGLANDVPTYRLSYWLRGNSTPETPIEVIKARSRDIVKEQPPQERGI